MGQSQQRPALLLDEIDLDQARPWRRVVAPFPAEAVGEAVDRDNLRESATSGVLAINIDEVKTIEMWFNCRLRDPSSAKSFPDR